MMNIESIGNLDKNLTNLATKSKQMHEQYKDYDFTDTHQLSPEEIKSWCKVLSGAATTEHLEETLLAPFAFDMGNDSRREYMKAHAQDEDRHYKMLSGYLKQTFGFEKSKKTFSDVLFNSLVLPVVINVFKKKPRYCLATLYFFETFSLEFYDQVIDLAKEKELPQLVKLIEILKKDECRHITGVKTLMEISALEDKKLSWLELSLIRLYMRLFILDISVSRWALHNRKMREKMQNLSLDVNDFNNKIHASRRRTIDMLRQMYMPA